MALRSSYTAKPSIKPPVTGRLSVKAPLAIQRRYTEKPPVKDPGSQLMKAHGSVNSRHLFTLDGRRKKLFSLINEDRLSNLPSEVIHTILGFLPLEDAVRTSILSRSWRYAWTNLSRLVFDSNSFPVYEPQAEYDKEIENIVYRVLLLHQGTLKRFELSLEIESCENIDRWILFVSRKSVGEFVLDKHSGDAYKIPTCLFSCKEMAYLNLFRCKLMPPTSFNGFRNLISLVLDTISISKDRLEKLISNSPLLAMLVLKYINDCTNLKIDAPNLVLLEIKSSLKDVSIQNSKFLAEASIELIQDGSDQTVGNRNPNKLTQLLVCLPGVKRLKLHGQTYQILSPGEIPETFLDNCQLRFLSASMDFNTWQHMSSTLWIIQNSPRLQEVHLQSIGNGKNGDCHDLGFWDALEGRECSFDDLRVLRLSDATGNDEELRFIKFVLAKSPALELVHILAGTNLGDETKFLKDLIRYPRVSSKAQIRLE